MNELKDMYSNKEDVSNNIEPEHFKNQNQNTLKS